jgi:hypothetical protein
LLSRGTISFGRHGISFLNIALTKLLTSITGASQTSAVTMTGCGHSRHVSIHACGRAREQMGGPIHLVLEQKHILPKPEKKGLFIMDS